MKQFSCLLIGPPGSGKTTAASTAPPPVLFLDMDSKLHKMENLKDKLAKKEIVQWTPGETLFKGTLTSFVTGGTNPHIKFTQQRAKGYLNLAEMLDKLEANKCVIDGVKFNTVVLDSYTSSEEHLKRLLMSANGVATITQPLWGTMLTNNENLNSSLLHLPANIIVICHERPDKDELTGKITYAPLIGGQMRDKIGKDFEEVYYLEKIVRQDKAIYEMLTIGNSMKACRTSRILEARVEPNFGKIYGKG